MPVPRPLPLLVSALVFTTLLVGLPMLHLGLHPSGPSALLLALPPLVLAASLLAPRRPVLTHLAFPLAHLPLLLLHPELTGPRVYGGASGVVAFLAVIAAGGAYVVATTPRLPASRARLEPLVALAFVIALAPLIALLLPALASDRAPWASLAALALGPLVAWWLVARAFARDVALPSLDPATRVRAFYALRERIRPRRAAFVLSVIAAVLALGLYAFWSLWSLR